MIRRSSPADIPALWRIYAQIIAEGRQFVERDDDLNETKFHRKWLGEPAFGTTALQDDAIIGGYVLKPNHAGRGSHIANATYMVAASARGQGWGWRLGEHSIGQARQLGYHAMQFNAVVKTNVGAVKLWQSLGFRIIATVPAAFLLPDDTYTDLYIMYRRLAEGE